MPDTSIEVIFEMFFLAFNNTNVSFIYKKFIWRFYIIFVALLITTRVKIIDKKEFAIAELDSEKKTFKTDIAFFSLGSKIIIYSA